MIQLTVIFVALLLPYFSNAIMGPLYKREVIEVPENQISRAPALVYLPSQYDSKAEWPLVLLLHGFTGTGKTEDTYLGLRFRVSSRGFILVTPSGTKNSEGKNFWNATEACCDFENSKVDDVSYLRRLIDQLRSQYKVDDKRIYIYGHSNGGFLANRLVCEMPKTFAAFTNLAGSSFKDLSRCKSSDPISMLHIHAKDDPTIKFGGTEHYPGAWDLIEHAIRRNSCTAQPKVGEPIDLGLLIPGIDTKVFQWNNCDSRSEVVFWMIEAYESKYHNPHIPIFRPEVTDRVLDFLFKQSR